jgi:hypothetical protein
MFFILLYYMRKSKRYQKKKKSRRSRKVRRSRRMKGGTNTPFSDLADAFSSIKYNIGNAVGVGMVDPVKVPPQVKGGDNPLPYKQLGSASDVTPYTNEVTAASTAQSVSSIQSSQSLTS